MLVGLSETEAEGGAGSGLSSGDLVLDLVELLAGHPRPRGVSDIARDLSISMARSHRHLRALVQRGYVRQDPETERYEIGVKLLALGEAVRDRFDILTAMRPEMTRLREATGQAVTASALVEGQVTVLEMLQGRTLVEFGLRPGARLQFHASAHGLLALAFGPPTLLDQVLSVPRESFTPATVTAADALRAEVERVRRQGWATAQDQVLTGVNALAAPVFDHRGVWRGALAIVGASQFIPAQPAEDQIAEVVRGAEEASRRLGWRARAA